MPVDRHEAGLCRSPILDQLIPLDIPESKRIRRYYEEEGTFFLIQDIIAHKRAGDLKDFLAERSRKWTGDPNDLLYLVRWKDYGVADDTWEPLSNVFFTEAFMRYFRKYLVPTIGRHHMVQGQHEVDFRFVEPRKRKNHYYSDKGIWMASFLDGGGIVELSARERRAVKRASDKFWDPDKAPIPVAPKPTRKRGRPRVRPIQNPVEVATTPANKKSKPRTPSPTQSAVEIEPPPARKRGRRRIYSPVPKAVEGEPIEAVIKDGESEIAVEVADDESTQAADVRRDPDYSPPPEEPHSPEPVKRATRRKRSMPMSAGRKRKQRRVAPEVVEELSQETLFGNAIEIDEDLLRNDAFIVTTANILGEDEGEQEVKELRRGRSKKYGICTYIKSDRRSKKSQKQLEMEKLRALASKYQVQRFDGHKDVVLDEDDFVNPEMDDFVPNATYDAQATDNGSPKNDNFDDLIDFEPVSGTVVQDDVYFDQDGDSGVSSAGDQVIPISASTSIETIDDAPIKDLTDRTIECHVYQFDVAVKFQPNDQLVDEYGRIFTFHNNQFLMGEWLGITKPNFDVATVSAECYYYEEVPTVLTSSVFVDDAQCTSFEYEPITVDIFDNIIEEPLNATVEQEAADVEFTRILDNMSHSIFDGLV